MGFLNNFFSKKETQKPDENWIKICLLAKQGEQKLTEEKYQEAITSLLAFFELKNKCSFPDLDYMEVPCYFNLALAYKHIAMYEEVIFYISKCILMHPNYYEAYKIRIEANFELENITDAIVDIDVNLKIKPNSKEMLMNKGIACLKIGDYHQAKDALIKAKNVGCADADFYIDTYL